ncbi:MAG: NRDE family protein [Congregibacter sp.]
MCLIAIAWQCHPDAPLLLVANRDEFHARPPAAAGFWEDHPDILGGRDLQAGGTWLGVTRGGRFAAVTNVREGRPATEQAKRSRGELTLNFLHNGMSPEHYIHQVSEHIQDYQGFNLLIGDGTALWYLHGGHLRHSKPEQLTPGTYALSNAALNTPWPKVEHARAKLERALDAASSALPGHDQLTACLADASPAAERSLPNTGVDAAMERLLSAQFIVSPTYGTRSCSSLRVLGDGTRDFQELRFDADGKEIGRERFTFHDDS